MIDVRCGIFGAGGAVAKVPQDAVFLEVDICGEGDGLFDAILERLVGLYLYVVDDQAGTEVFGVGADEVGIAFGVAETIHMGIETVGTADMVNAVGDVLPDEAVVVVAVDTVEEKGREQLPVKVHAVDVFRVDDDVDAVDIDVDARVVEGGEGDVVDALLNGRNPHH